MNKRILSLLLAIVMVLGVCAAGFTAFAADYTDNGDGKHTTPDGEIEDHKFINYIYDRNATCTENGTETAECESGCGAKDTREAENTATGHIDIDVDYVCDICEEELKRCKNAGHDFEKAELIFGEDFAEKFADALTEEEITELKEECHFFKCVECNTWLPFNHKLEIGYKGEGTPYHWIGCSECDYKKDWEKHKDVELNYVGEDGNMTTDGLCDVCKGELQHRYKKSGGTSASCLKGGVNKYTCMNCGDEYEETTSAALGHDWGREPDFTWDTVNFRSCTATFTCARNDCEESVKYQRYTVYAGSGYKDNMIAKTSETKPTCTEDGEIIYTATFTVDDMGVTGWSGMKKNADGTYTFSTTYKVKVPATGHNFDIIESSTKATCTKDGEISYKCSNPGCTKINTVVDVKSPALGHNVEHYESDGNATCTESGTMSGICSRCGEKQTVEEPGSALGHIIAEPEEKNKIEATCEEDGSYDSVILCGRCHEVMSTNHVIVPALGHENSEPIADKTKAATCEKDGYEVRKCPKCNKEYRTDIPKLGGEHNWSEFSIVEDSETCLVEYAEIRECSRCKVVERKEKLKPNASHDWGEYVTIKPTCTEEGSKVRTCKKCGEEDETPIPKLGHDLTSRVTTKPTCYSTGVETITCSRCNHKETNAIARLSHTYDYDKPDYTNGKMPTCTENGIAIYKCKTEGCDSIIERTENALGHNYKLNKDSNKNYWYSCTRCGKVKEKCAGDHTDPKLDLDFDRVCDVCGAKIEFKSNALHYITGIPQFWLRVIFRFISGGSIDNMFITRGK